MRFESYSSLAARAHVVVDGAANESTTLVLSHWPKSGTPRALLADTSAEIVFRWLDSRARVDAELVSNDHFDEDGLVALWTMIHPDEAASRRARLVAIASAGDFAVCRDRDAVRAALTVAAFADPDTSPLDASVFVGSYAERTAALYAALLPRLAEIADAPHRFRNLWAEEDARIDEDARAIASGEVTIEEIPELDLAVVTLPRARADHKIHRFAGARRASLHPVAVHAATQRSCLLFTQSGEGARHEVQLRYEGWVQLVSRGVRARRDLSSLAATLGAEDDSPWSFDGVEKITPKLTHAAPRSRLAPSRVRASLEDALRTLPAAWDPFSDQ